MNLNSVDYNRFTFYLNREQCLQRFGNLQETRLIQQSGVWPTHGMETMTTRINGNATCLCMTSCKRYTQ